jgi:hypothetical protein
MKLFNKVEKRSHLFNKVDANKFHLFNKVHKHHHHHQHHNEDHHEEKEHVSPLEKHGREHRNGLRHRVREGNY